MTTSLRLRIQSATLLVLALSACAPTTPRLDQQFGESVRATMASQVSDPAAGQNGNPVSGVDGRAARAAQERYERSFAQAHAGADVPPALVNAK